MEVGAGGPAQMELWDYKPKLKELHGQELPKSVIAELQSYLRGSVNYYQLGILFGEARDLDGWLRLARASKRPSWR